MGRGERCATARRHSGKSQHRRRGRRAAIFFAGITMQGMSQDDWKFRPNFTLNLNLRYEFFGALSNKGFAHPQLGALELAGAADHQFEVCAGESLLSKHTGRFRAFVRAFTCSRCRARERWCFAGGIGVSFDNFDEEPILTGI